MLEELEKLRKEKERATFAEDVISAKSGNKRRFRHLYETANPLEEQESEQYSLPRALKIGDTVMVVIQRYDEGKKQIFGKIVGR